MKSPVVILYDAAGKPLAVQDGVAIPAGTSGLLQAGKDGSGNTQFLSMDTDGRPKMDVDRWFGSAVPTVGQKTMASSLPVTLASDSSSIPVTFALTGAVTGITMGVVQEDDVTTDRDTPIRLTPYTEPTSAAQRSLKSDDTGDASAGIGARTVKITYFDNSLNGPYTETVTMNGTTAVNTVATNIRFIEKLEVMTTGTARSNEGIITLYSTTGGGGTVIGTIDRIFGKDGAGAWTGDNRTIWAHHYVPTGKLASLATLIGGTDGNQNGAMFLRTTNPLITAPNIIASDFINIALNNPSVVRALGIPIIAVGPMRVELHLIPAGNGTRFYGSFDYSEVDA